MSIFAASVLKKIDMATEYSVELSQIETLVVLANMELILDRGLVLPETNCSFCNRVVGCSDKLAKRLSYDPKASANFFLLDKKDPVLVICLKCFENERHLDSSYDLASMKVF